MEVIIVGGGIVGLATAHAVLERSPAKSVLLLEKEERLALHQTGRNSGVIHSGIYYTPGGFKARLCKTGNQSMVEFCQRHGVQYNVCGKVIVATRREELSTLERLSRRGRENGLSIRNLSLGELREIEPHCSAIATLHVPSTGVVDYNRVAAKLADLVEAAGGEVRCGVEVVGIKGRTVETTGGTFEAKQIINCSGLHSDRVARLAGARLESTIVPFRGEYYALRPEKAGLVKTMIYPVPNPSFPFLGVHCTRMIDGSVHLGPNAVVAFAREGYKKTTVNLRDVGETLTFPGFWRLAARHWREGCREIVRSFSRAAFARAVQRLVPSIEEDDLIECGAGVRAQAVHSSGALEDDFIIIKKGNAIHVCNAPSPAATAALEIGKHIARLLDS